MSKMIIVIFPVIIERPCIYPIVHSHSNSLQTDIHTHQLVNSSTPPTRSKGETHNRISHVWSSSCKSDMGKLPYYKRLWGNPDRRRLPQLFVCVLFYFPPFCGNSLKIASKEEGFQFHVFIYLLYFVWFLFQHHVLVTFMTGPLFTGYSRLISSCSLW